jgi:DNA-binding NarL/FixJ family response regulator
VKSLKEIAAEIDRSPKTVEKHVTSLKKKVGAGNDTALAAFALRAGLLPRSDRNDAEKLIPTIG